MFEANVPGTCVYCEKTVTSKQWTCNDCKITMICNTCPELNSDNTWSSCTECKHAMMS